MDASFALSFLAISLFCFTFVFWIKKNEHKHKYRKTKMVDRFIQQKNVRVDEWYASDFFDLVLDRTSHTLWFFYLRNQTLHYKNIQFRDLFQIEYKLDGKSVRIFSRSGMLKNQLVAGSRDLPNVTVKPCTEMTLEQNFRVKEIAVTILVDELTPYHLDFIFTVSHLPVELKNAKDKDAKKWYRLLHEIIDTTEKSDR